MNFSKSKKIKLNKHICVSKHFVVELCNTLSEVKERACKDACLDADTITPKIRISDEQYDQYSFDSFDQFVNNFSSSTRIFSFELLYASGHPSDFSIYLNVESYARSTESYISVSFSDRILVEDTLEAIHHKTHHFIKSYLKTSKDAVASVEPAKVITITSEEDKADQKKLNMRSNIFQLITAVVGALIGFLLGKYFG